MSISDNLAAVRRRIYSSAVNAGRDPQDIRLVAVTKTVGLVEIVEAVKAGVVILGENRVREAKAKSEELRAKSKDLKIQWHLIGHLQKNKAKQAVQLFDLIHSVDSIELAAEINMQANKINKIQKALVQVKLSKEETKHGVPEEDLTGLMDKVGGMSNLSLEGLMTMPPYFDDPEDARPYFKRLKKIRDEFEGRGFKLPELSMGMSNDFGVAIEEGATMVRIGTAIFGERNI